MATTRTPRTTRTLTPDFADSPFRVAYDRVERSYVVVSADDVEGLHHGYTGGDPAGYTCAYELAAELNTEHAAEVADSAMALEDERAETVVISRPGLTWNAIRVTRQSTVNRGVRQIGSYSYEGVVVDNVFVALVRTAHYLSNETLLKIEIAGVVTDLVDAIRRLNPDWPQLESEQLAQRADAAADGDEPPSAAGCAVPVAPRANPYRAERWLDEERVIDIRTGQIVHSQDYAQGVVPSAREWWLNELRAQVNWGSALPDEPDPDAALRAYENALAARCSCFRVALLNGDNERPACTLAGRCLDEHPDPPPPVSSAATPPRGTPARTAWPASPRPSRRIWPPSIGSRTAMQHSSFDSYRRHPIQLAHLAADPLLYLWIDQDRLEQFLLDELAGLDPFAVQIAAQEEKFLRKLNGLGPVYYRSE